MGFLENTLGDSPIVAAVKDEPGLERCLNSPCRVVFVLFGDLNSVPRIVAELKTAGKTVFVHADLIEGLSAREAAVDYLIHAARPDGIISTRLPLLRFAKAKGLRTILRFKILFRTLNEKLDKHINFVQVLNTVFTCFHLSHFSSSPLFVITEHPCQHKC